MNAAIEDGNAVRTEKEQVEWRRAKLEELHTTMDKEFDERRDRLDHRERVGETDTMWRLISAAAEAGLNKFLKLDPKELADSRGRGIVTILDKTNKPRPPEDVSSKDPVRAMYNVTAEKASQSAQAYSHKA